MSVRIRTAARRPVLPPSPRPLNGRQTEQPASRPRPVPRQLRQPARGRPVGRLAGLERLVARVDALPSQVRDMARRGLRKVVDYQDSDYGRDYLDRLGEALALDSGGQELCSVRGSRQAPRERHVLRRHHPRCRSEDALGARRPRAPRSRPETEGSLVEVTEFFHPRIEEFCGTLPAGLGRFIEDRPKLSAALDRVINRGRRVRTDGIAGFATLWLIAGLRRWRRAPAAPSGRNGASAALVRPGARDGSARLCARRRSGRVPPPHQGLQRHPRARLSKFERVLSGLPLCRAAPTRPTGCAGCAKPRSRTRRATCSTAR